MNQKGLANIVLIVVIVAIITVGGYFIFVKKSEPAIFSELEILTNLKANWQSIQTLIPFRPAYHNQIEDAKKIWRSPKTVQFIGRNSVLVRFEDDDQVHVAVFKFDDSKFDLLEVFKNQGEFILSEWQNLVKKYGNIDYLVSTYTTDLVRNKQIVSFQDLTKVPENIFIRNYWEN